MKTFISIIFCTLFLNTASGQQQKSDSLFFKYDNKYIISFKESPEHYYLKDSHNGSSGTFFFKEVKRIPNLKAAKLKCLKKFVRSSKFYDKKEKLHDREIAALFNQSVVFLVLKTKKNTEYIQVQGGFEIE